jgi:hypothetical protein
LFVIIIIVLISGHVSEAQSIFKQLVYASSNATATSNAITKPTRAAETEPSSILFLTKPTGNFNATGSISSLVVSNNNNITADAQYVLSGNWNVLASNGNITYFGASFTMVSVNGSNRHTHSITNFSSNVIAPLILDIHGTTFTGESDITTNGNVTWHAEQTTVTIAEHDVIKISLDEPDVSSHFLNQPIYGVIFSIQEHESPQ